MESLTNVPVLYYDPKLSTQYDSEALNRDYKDLTKNIILGENDLGHRLING